MIITKNIWTKKRQKKPNCFGSSLWMSKQSMPPMSLELGHYKWCHTGYHYTHIPKQLSWLYGTIRHQEQGNPSDVKLGSIEKRKKIQSIKMTNFQIWSSVQQINPIYDSCIPCLNYHCIIVTEINIIVCMYNTTWLLCTYISAFLSFSK